MATIGIDAEQLFIQPTSFEHILSTGLQLPAHSKMLVYNGFALLFAGVFCMFYVPAKPPVVLSSQRLSLVTGKAVQPPGGRPDPVSLPRRERVAVGLHSCGEL